MRTFPKQGREPCGFTPTLPAIVVVACLVVAFTTACARDSSEKSADRTTEPTSAESQRAAGVAVSGATTAMGPQDVLAPPPGAGGPDAPLGPSGNGTAPSVAQVEAVRDWETSSSGISPPALPEAASAGTPTPNEIPGARLVTSDELRKQLESSAVRPIVVDVAGGPQRLPGAVLAEFAGSAGTYSDATQKRLAEFLSAQTGGRKNAHLVFYCDGPDCWGSYNASLRAVNLGYTNVHWYRGGIAAWQRVGLQTKPPNWGIGPDGKPWGEAAPRP